jgi:mortality factor 4-like protein 1
MLGLFLCSTPLFLLTYIHTVNLPELIAQTNMDSQSVNRLREEISKFCTWLARNSGRFFCAKYEKPSAEYIENAR